MNKYQNKLRYIVTCICGFALLGVVTSCNKFLDVNSNPNNTESADPNLLLPSSEVAVGLAIGNGYQVFGSILSQYWTQSPSSSQYKYIEQTLFRNTDFDYPWSYLYRDALIHIQKIVDSKKADQEQYIAVANILKAYSFQIATDAFGDVPVTEALGDAHNPTFENQEAVYDHIFQFLDEAKALIDVNSDHTPGTEDFIFGGDMQQWLAFANTLELRAYLRLSEVDAAKAQAGIKKLYDEGAEFLTKDATMKYTTTGSNQNPLYTTIVGLGKVQNLVASQTVVKAFLRNNDPRLGQLYDKLDGQDTIAYIPQGAFANVGSKRVSPPSAFVGANAQNPASAIAPVQFISAAESYFLQAEAVARGWATGSQSAEELFKAGIEASFASDGIATDAADYIASAPDAVFPSAKADQIKAIITQKYYAMCGTQGFEAWTEWRRTGYPDFLEKNVQTGEVSKALRFLYPSGEVNTNVQFPGTVPLTTPVWWDK